MCPKAFLYETYKMASMKEEQSILHALKQYKEICTRIFSWASNLLALSLTLLPQKRLAFSTLTQLILVVKQFRFLIYAESV